MNSYNNNSFNSRSYKHSRQINSNKNRRYITKKDEIKYSSRVFNGNNLESLSFQNLFKSKSKKKKRLEDK
jgi:hypothetical protein